MLIDTHAHLNFNAFKNDADEVIKKSLASDVFMINAGSQYATSKRAMEMAEKYETGIYAAVGLHPIHIKTAQNAKRKTQNEDEKYSEEFDFEKYLELAKNKKIVAIGEMGLDYFHIDNSVAARPLQIAKQKEIFLEGIKLANEVQEPMIIHCREAYDDLLEILQKSPVDKKGVIHCFVGSWKTAQKFIEYGYKIGLNGIITYSNSYNKLIDKISISDILLETDCPYLTPKPLAKNERNEPINVRFVAAKIAEIKKISQKEVAEKTFQNAKSLFDFADRAKK